MIRGYFRVAPDFAATTDQLASLMSLGASSGNIFFDNESDHIELYRALDSLEPGDTFLVLQLSDIYQDFRQIFDLINQLRNKRVILQSIHEPWFNLTPEKMEGDLLYKLLEQLYHLTFQKPHSPPSDRQQKPRRSVGRPKGCSQQTEYKINRALRLYEQNTNLTVSEICAKLNLNERTFYRHLSSRSILSHRPKGRKPNSR